MKNRALQAILWVLACCLTSVAFALPEYNMSVGVTSISHDTFRLHMLIFYVVIVIGILVFAVLFYSLFAYRKSKGAVAAHFHDHVWIEVAWTVIPFLILIAIMVPTTKVLLKMNDDHSADTNIKVTGIQWKNDYLDEGTGFYSNLSTPMAQIQNKEPKGRWYLHEVDHPLVVPIHKKIHFLVTSNDVNHSWWVPDLAVKCDAISGFIHEGWAKIDRPGVYRGQCAELCGVNHGFMPIVVVAKTQADYDVWVKAHKGQQILSSPSHGTPASAPPAEDMSKETLLKEGEAGHVKYCSACHQINGGGLGEAIPILKGASMAVGDVAGHINVVLHGAPGTAMQVSSEQLSDREIAAILTYERNAWGNDSQETYGYMAGGII